MTSCIKSIFRFDFAPSYALIDRMGTALSFLDDDGAYWTEFGETRAGRRIVAKVENDAYYGELTVEPTAIHGTLECPTDDGGLELNRFMDISSKACSALMEEFKINKIKRGGFRQYCFAAINDVGLAHVRSGGRLRDRLLQNDRWQVADVAVIVEGSTGAEEFFRLQCGPKNEAEPNRWLVKVKDTVERDANQLSADVDVYERDFDFRGSSLKRWSKNKRATIENLINVARETIQQ